MTKQRKRHLLDYMLAWHRQKFTEAKMNGDDTSAAQHSVSIAFYVKKHAENESKN